ncbi:hypothetical protein ColTof4_09160 [Colletotrichum tofieldiae]|nr:hypothetical protein ColTof3_03632 [Colletotrichum tofieldiae]GKT76737.1 hypothetical protein ColTof4_09160 [Colletotrichum tofieldiae]
MVALQPNRDAHTSLTGGQTPKHHLLFVSFADVNQSILLSNTAKCARWYLRGTGSPNKKWNSEVTRKQCRFFTEDTGHHKQNFCNWD